MGPTGQMGQIWVHFLRHWSLALGRPGQSGPKMSKYAKMALLAKMAISEIMDSSRLLGSVLHCQMLGSRPQLARGAQKCQNSPKSGSGALSRTPSFHMVLVLGTRPDPQKPRFWAYFGPFWPFNLARYRGPATGRPKKPHFNCVLWGF